jgi:hypothetical protein
VIGHGAENVTQEMLPVPDLGALSLPAFDEPQGLGLEAGPEFGIPEIAVVDEQVGTDLEPALQKASDGGADALELRLSQGRRRLPENQELGVQRIGWSRFEQEVVSVRAQEGGRVDGGSRLGAEKAEERSDHRSERLFVSAGELAREMRVLVLASPRAIRLWPERERVGFFGQAHPHVP